MIVQPKLDLIPALSLAGIWAGVLSALPLLPLRSKLSFSLSNHGWGGFEKWALPIAGAAIGLAMASAVAVSVVSFRRTRTRVIAASLLGFVFLLVTTALATYCLRGYWISTDTLPYLAWGAAYLGPLAAAGLALATDYSLKRTGLPTVWRSGLTLHAILGSSGGALFWLVVPDHRGWVTALGFLSGATFGALFFIAERIAARIIRTGCDPQTAPRLSNRARYVIGASLLVSIIGIAAVVISTRQPIRPYLRMPKGRAFHALLEYFEDHRRVLETVPPNPSIEAATGPLIQRWPALSNVDSIEGKTLEEVISVYVRERVRLDPEWATYQGLLEGADHLTRHRDEDVSARLKLDLSLYKALQRLPGDDAKQIRQMLTARFLIEGQADYRSTFPAYALGGLEAVFVILQRDDLSAEARFQHATRRLRELPLVLGDFRKSIIQPADFLTTAGIEACSSSADFLNSLEDQYPAQSDFLAALKTAANEVNAFRRFLEEAPKSKGATVGVGAQAYLNVLLAEGETRTSRELALLARNEMIDSYDNFLNVGMNAHFNGTLELSELKKHEVSDVLSRFRDEMKSAKQRLDTEGHYPRPVDSGVMVMEAPPHYRSWTEPASYWPLGDIEGPRKGLVLLTLSGKDDPQYDEYTLRRLTWHETFPGHHLQHMMARDHAPLARRVFPSAFFLEGWATYAAEDMGNAWEKSDDPLSTLCRILSRIEISLPVLEDIFIHVCQPTAEEAIVLLAKAHRMSRSDAEVRLSNILSSPSRRSSYLLGSKELLNAREKLREEMGDRFSKRWFHESLLKLGPVAPSRIVELLRNQSAKPEK